MILILHVSGLELKEEKTWVLSPEDFNRDGTKIPGSFIGGKSSDSLKEKSENFENTCGRLSLLPTQEAYLMLRMCAIPQFTHLLRGMRADQATWQRFDSSIRGVLLSALRRFEIDAVDDKILSLPMRRGGLGLALPSLIADIYFEASQAESFTMLSKQSKDLILPEVEFTRKQKDRVQSLHNDWTPKLESELSDFLKRRFAVNASRGGSVFLQTFLSEPYYLF